MSKHTHHHPAPKRGPKSSAAHKVWAKARMDTHADSILRGREKLLVLLFHPGFRRDTVITRASKLASAIRRAFA